MLRYVTCLEKLVKIAEKQGAEDVAAYYALLIHHPSPIAYYLSPTDTIEDAFCYCDSFFGVAACLLTLTTRPARLNASSLHKAT